MYLRGMPVVIPGRYTRYKAMYLRGMAIVIPEKYAPCNTM